MSVRRSAILLLVLCGSAAQADWETHVSSDDSPFMPGRASIQYKPNNGDIPTFRDAIDQLCEAGRLDRLEMITIHGAVIEPDFQAELIETLETHAPEEFAEARASAGNINNPAMEPLRAVFNDVVLEMPMLRRLDAELRDAGRTIHRVSHEKLWLFERDGELFVMAMLWLSVEAV